MRPLSKVEMPSEAGNAAIRDPNFGQKMQSVLKEVGAEAAYFTAVEGQRGAAVTSLSIWKMRLTSPQSRSRFFFGSTLRLNFSP